MVEIGSDGRTSLQCIWTCPLLFPIGEGRSPSLENNQPTFFQLVVLENTLKEIYVVLLFHFNMSLIVIQIQLQSNLPNDLLFESEHLVFKTKDL